MKELMTAACVAVFGLCVTGCGDSGRKPVFPVSGKVTFGGQPAKGATVVFHPIGESGPDVLKPRGRVNDDGQIELTTYDSKDGAPAGDYEVTVEWYLSPGKDLPPANRLPAKFGQPSSSGIKATVAKGPNALPDIDLKK